jgi:thioester reductase-like protein
VVGSAIVPILLALPDTEVHLLIRAESDAALANRIQELLRYWGWEDDAAKVRRIHGHRGDAAVTNFGLDEVRYKGLVATCSHIIHSAGTVRMNLALEDARRSAVGSAQEILTLAKAVAQTGRLKKVDIVSTVGVAGKRSGTLPETWLDQMPAFHNTYEQAKAEAEVLIREAVEKECLPITVHRPSMVIGDSCDGRVIHFQIFYFLCEFLSGRKTAGLYPDFSEVQLDIISSDSVATAIVAASRDPATSGKIFHLCSGPEIAPRLEDLKAAVRQAFAVRGLSVPRGVNIPIRWYGRLARLGAWLAPSSQRKALATLPIYLDYLADRQGFGNPQFFSWFKSQGHQLPKWDGYLPRVLDYYLTERYPSSQASGS